MGFFQIPRSEAVAKSQVISICNVKNVIKNLDWTAVNRIICHATPCYFTHKFSFHLFWAKNPEKNIRRKAIKWSYHKITFKRNKKHQLNAKMKHWNYLIRNDGACYCIPCGSSFCGARSYYFIHFCAIYQYSCYFSLLSFARSASTSINVLF